MCAAVPNTRQDSGLKVPSLRKCPSRRPCPDGCGVSLADGALCQPRRNKAGRSPTEPPNPRTQHPTTREDPVVGSSRPPLTRLSVGGSATTSPPAPGRRHLIPARGGHLTPSSFRRRLGLPWYWWAVIERASELS